MSDDNVFSVLGIADDEEFAYRAIVGEGALGLEELADRWSELAANRAEVRGLLERLQEMGLVELVVGSPTLYRAARATHVLEGLALTREESALEIRSKVLVARAHIKALAQAQAESAGDTSPSEILEVVLGRTAVHERANAIFRMAAEQIRCLDRPPYANRASGDNPEEAARLKCGLTVRAIYDVTSLEQPGRMVVLHDTVGKGEQARVMAGVPVKLLICDDKLALLPFHPSRAIESALVVHPCALLDALIALFESCWQRATPIGGGLAVDHAQPVTRDAEPILSLMAMGLSDRAVAENLGIGLRTLQKRLSELQAAMGARNRFELGLRAGAAGVAAPAREAVG